MMSGVTLTELRTPAVLIERPRAVNNIRRMQQLAKDAGMALRPHAKTHTSPELARWQLETAAEGVSGEDDDQRDAQARQSLEGAVSGPGPVAPHFERRQAAPSRHCPSSRKCRVAPWK